VITVRIRKQGGAGVITIPADLLKLLNVEMGTELALDIENGNLIAHPLSDRQFKKRYTLQELLQGITPKVAAAMKEETEALREGNIIGRELL